jgi:hypothetical protein
MERRAARIRVTSRSHLELAATTRVHECRIHVGGSAEAMSDGVLHSWMCRVRISSILPRVAGAVCAVQRDRQPPGVEPPGGAHDPPACDRDPPPPAERDPAPQEPARREPDRPRPLQSRATRSEGVRYAAQLVLSSRLFDMPGSSVRGRGLHPHRAAGARGMRGLRNAVSGRRVRRLQRLPAANEGRSNYTAPRGDDALVTHADTLRRRG